MTRRAFLAGAALALGAVPLEASSGPAAGHDPYPPARGGLRGAHPGSFEAAHELARGGPVDLGRLPVAETVDLVVVGAGISGLAAAWYYRERFGPTARILLLDNHDDFGGHAKRVELDVDGRTLLGYAGGESLQRPRSWYGPTALALLAALGVDLDRLAAGFEQDLYPSLGLSRGVFFNAEAFGTDRLVAGDPLRGVVEEIPAERMNARPLEAFLGDFPLAPTARAQLLELYRNRRDWLPGLDRAAKADLLRRTSYRTYLTRHCGLDELAADCFQGRTHGYSALGIDAVPAAEAKGMGYPGFAGLGLDDPTTPAEVPEPYVHHFPDGNASVARLLVRALVPAAAPGRTMEDVLTARFDYAALDGAGPVRLRLDATVVAVANRAGGGGGGVEVGYLRGREVVRVQARHAVMAGWGMMVPLLLPELAAPQAEALRANVKAPLVYTKVGLRRWDAFTKLGVHDVAAPMAFHSQVKLDFPVSLGAYRHARRPDQPIGLHLVHVPDQAGSGLTARERYRVGRAQLQAMTCADFTAATLDQLTRMLGAGGFDAARDVAAITVCRWPHGYSYSTNSLDDAPGERERLTGLVRQRVGNVTIAGADAGWLPYLPTAIGEASRAVDELPA